MTAAALAASELLEPPVALASPKDETAMPPAPRLKVITLLLGIAMLPVLRATGPFGPSASLLVAPAGVPSSASDAFNFGPPLPTTRA